MVINTQLKYSFIFFYILFSGNEMPQIRASNVPKQNKGNQIDCINIDRVINQVKKHAAVNYSYYTRTK